MTQIAAESLINFNSFHEVAIKELPFPYMVIPHFLNLNYLSALIEAFPTILHRGSIPANSVSSHSLFQQLITELEGPTLRQWIAEKFAMDLQDKPTMLTLRAHTNERDGHIHTDSTSKLITVLLYMNPIWSSDEGKLRLLYNNNSLENYFEEISPLAGNCLIFKVTPNGWHGHTTFIGKRLSLQLNYLSGGAALTKHLNHHRFTAWLKRWYRKVVEENY